METLSPTWSTELHTRVDDYLNDKLQTASDIDTLDALLTDVQNRQALLKKQVSIYHNISSADADKWAAGRSRRCP